MTDNEIIKALECYRGQKLFAFNGKKPEIYIHDILDLIDRQKAEIERLNNAYKQCAFERDAYIEIQNTAVAEAKAEAYKEVVERLHCHCESIINQEWNKRVAPVSWADAYEEFDNEVDNLLKELEGDNDEKTKKND